MMIRTTGWDAVRGLCPRATPARFALTVLAAIVAVTLVACSGESGPGGESTSPESTDLVSALDNVQCPTPEEYRQAVGLGEVPEVTRSSDPAGIACRYEYDNFSLATSLIAMVNPHGDPLTFQVLPVLRERAAQRLTQPADGPTRARKVEPVSGVGQEAYALVETSGDAVREVDLWAVDGQFRIQVSGSFSSMDEASRAANLWLAALRSE